MKRVLVTFVFIITLVTANRAQVNQLPGNTVVIPYRLEVGYNVNTALNFPGNVKKAYWGFKDIMAQTVPDVGNVLLVKAATKDFEPTNLHVFTGDGKVYCFNVFYSPEPNQTTFDLSKIDSANCFPKSIDISFSSQLVNEDELQSIIEKVKNKKALFSKSDKEYEMKIELKGIYFTHNLLFFSFKLSNRSTLDYDPDFLRLYIKDKKRSKRSSAQDREIIPINKLVLPTIQGRSSSNFVIAVPKFTIPNKKRFYLEVFERNGGRNISLNIKNRHLFMAKPMYHAKVRN
jgi:conjugative transposon TraN protein